MSAKQDRFQVAPPVECLIFLGLSNRPFSFLPATRTPLPIPLATATPPDQHTSLFVPLAGPGRPKDIDQKPMHFLDRIMDIAHTPQVEAG